MFLTEIIPPVGEPLDLDEVKRQLRITHTHQDAYIASLIEDARYLFIQKTNHMLMETELMLTLNCFMPAIILLRGPVLSVSNLAYTDKNGVNQTIASADYIVKNIDNKMYSVCPADGVTWPLTSGLEDSVRITYKVGYPSQDDIPRAVKRWMHMMITDWFTQKDTGPHDDLISAFKQDHFYV